MPLTSLLGHFKLLIHDYSKCQASDWPFSRDSQWCWSSSSFQTCQFVHFQFHFRSSAWNTRTCTYAHTHLDTHKGSSIIWSLFIYLLYLLILLWVLFCILSVDVDVDLNFPLGGWLKFYSTLFYSVEVHVFTGLSFTHILPLLINEHGL